MSTPERLLLPSGGLAVLSPFALRLPHLAAFFPETRLAPPWRAFGAPVWAGWGNKRASRAIEAAASALGRGFIRLEDGFLRSVGLGKAGAAPHSIVVDDIGVYYDASRPSRLEQLIAEVAPPAAARGAELRARLVAERLSKYNSEPDRPLALGPRRAPRILLVDQVHGDLSIAGALADATTFAAMLATARAERPEAELLLRPHPDVVAGWRRGHIALDAPGVRVIADAVAAHAVLDACDEVWTVSSQLGFEALLRGLPVVTFGMPFYAGWGLTHDRAAHPLAVEARRRRAVVGVSVDHLAAAALDLYPRYADPRTRMPLDAHGAIDCLIALRRNAAP